MAVNVNVGELYRSAENHINTVCNILRSDKRSNKSWCDEVFTSINAIKQTLDVFKEELSKQTISSQGKQHVSYASVVQTKAPVVSTKHVVVISPKDEEIIKDSEQTLKLAQETVNTKSLKVGVNRIKKIRTKGVVLELRNEEECKIMVSSIENSNHQLKAYIPRKRNPRVIIHGIEVNFPDNELIESIVEQNPSIKQALTGDDDMRLLFARKTRNGNAKYAVVEVTPAIYRNLMNCVKIYVGFSSCKVKEYVSVIRCYKCLGFGHFSTDCNKEQCCSHCSEVHGVNSCPRTRIECVNCKLQNQRNSTRNQQERLNTQHLATSLDCPIYQKIYNIIKSKINYG